MKTLNCLIVDDEPLSQDVLKKYILDTPGLNLIGCCYNALEAIEMIRDYPIDLIFLDINMPKLTGINFIKSIDNPPMVIFTTAYPQYAVEGFDLDAVDYLLKPISFERFLKGANKAFEIFSRKSVFSVPGNEGFMTIKADKKIHRIDYSDILFFQSYGDFVKVHLSDNRVLITSDTLKNLERQLPGQFMRVHKSYILSISRIKFIEGNMARIGNFEIPLSQGQREVLLSRLNPQANQNDT